MKQTDQPGSRRPRKGFTILEVMVSVGIVGVLALVATPGILKRLPHHRLNRASWQVYSDLQRARMQAVSDNTTVRVTFDNAADEYTIWVDADRDGNVDHGEESTRALRDLRNADLYAYPETGIFRPNGTVEGDYYYWYIRVHVAPAGYKYVYVFPNGHIDPYNLQNL